MDRTVCITNCKVRHSTILFVQIS